MSRDIKNVDWVLTGCLLAICIVVGFIYHGFLYEGHNWGDDFALYLHLARNLAEGQPYNALNPGIRVPPGFPVLLAAWGSVFSWDLVAFKTINIVALGALALSSYFAARAFLSAPLAFLVALVVLTSPQFFASQQHILTDMPFATACIAALVCGHLATRTHTTRRRRYFAALAMAILLFAAFSLRSAALALSLSLLAHFATRAVADLHLHRRRPVELIGIAALTILVTWFGLWISGESSADHVLMMSHEVSGTDAAPEEGPRIGDIVMLVANSVDRLHQEMRYYQQIILFFPINEALSPILFALTVFGLITRVVCSRSVGVFEWFFLIYLAMILLTPWPGGPRYLFPIAPLGVIYLVILAQVLVRWLSNWVGVSASVQPWFVAVALAFLIAHNIDRLQGMRNFNDDEIGLPESVELVNWLRDNTPPADVICAFKPRAIVYLTRRPGCWLPPRDLEEPAGDWLKRKHARYAVTTRNPKFKKYVKATERLLNDPSLREVFHNRHYVVLELGPES